MIKIMLRFMTLVRVDFEIMDCVDKCLLLYDTLLAE